LGEEEKFICQGEREKKICQGFLRKKKNKKSLTSANNCVWSRQQSMGTGLCRRYLPLLK